MGTNKDLQHTFSKILREKRKACGLSQEGLALQAGIDRTFVSLMERGQRQPSLSTLFALCASLGIKPSALLSEIEESLNH